MLWGILLHGEVVLYIIYYCLLRLVRFPYHAYIWIYIYDNSRFKIECCGIDGPEDWKLVTRGGELPSSCCYAVQIDQSCTENNSYTIGCFEKFKTNLQENSQIIFWCAIGFTLVQVCLETIYIILSFKDYPQSLDEKLHPGWLQKYTSPPLLQSPYF